MIILALLAGVALGALLMVVVSLALMVAEAHQDYGRRLAEETMEWLPARHERKSRQRPASCPRVCLLLSPVSTPRSDPVSPRGVEVDQC